MKKYDSSEVQSDIISKTSAPDRDTFEYALQMGLIGKAIKHARQERHLTQEQLGQLIGARKSQISKLESNTSNATTDTLVRVFKALRANVKLKIELR